MRLALGFGFILPVFDRLGILGPSGAQGVAWGTWDNFIAYTQTLVPFANESFAGVVGTFATVAETVLGICLILGWKTRIMAILTAGLTAMFGICMTIFLYPLAAVSYPVYVFTAAALLLASIDRYPFSIDFGTKLR